MVRGLNMLVVILVCLLCINPAMAEIVSYDFESGSIDPAFTITQGDAVIVTSSAPVGNELRFAWQQSNKVTLDFAAADGPMSISYKLRLNDNYSSGTHDFRTKLRDTDTGLEMIEYASANLGFGVQGGGSTGFHSYDGFGNFAACLPAAAGLGAYDTHIGYDPSWTGPRKTMQFDFDPTTGVEFYFDGTLMCQWPNFTGQTKVNQIEFESNPDQGYYWMIDDVSVTYVPEPATMALLAIGGLMLRRRR